MSARPSGQTCGNRIARASCRVGRSWQARHHHPRRSHEITPQHPAGDPAGWRRGLRRRRRVLLPSGHPAVVVRPEGPEEVARALGYAADRDHPIAIRSGGHSPLGHGSDTEGLVIDLRRLDAVDVLDTDRRLVRIGAGATWGAGCCRHRAPRLGHHLGGHQQRRCRRPHSRRWSRLAGAPPRTCCRQPRERSHRDRRRHPAHRVDRRELGAVLGLCEVAVATSAWSSTSTSSHSRSRLCTSAT